MNILFKDILYK